MAATGGKQVLNVIRQHAEEAAILWHARTFMVKGPNIRLRHLGRLDQRLAAHLDGLAVAGESGWAACASALARPAAGELFTAAVRAIEDKNEERLEKLFALAQAVPEALPGLAAAFGWVSGQYLQGTIKALLESPDVFRQQLGVAACSMHRVDPGRALQRLLAAADPCTFAAGLRAVGECGRIDLLGACMAALDHDDPSCRYFAARSAILLGDRSRSIAALEPFALQAGTGALLGLGLLLKVLDSSAAASLLKVLARDPCNARRLVHGAGMSGDCYYVNWLIGRMVDQNMARAAGEAFSLLAGADLTALGLERKPPQGADFGPNDDPQHLNVATDEDEGLPWPDPEKVQAWWDANQNRFRNGLRYFMGEQPSLAHCTRVLREGYQRQRMAAAEYLCLLQPGTRLLPTSAPAWRQERWLRQMES